MKSRIWLLITNNGLHAIKLNQTQQNYFAQKHVGKKKMFLKKLLSFRRDE